MATPSSVPSTTDASSAPLLSNQAQDIPIFLRKTYHMVDTCDPSIACWSDDGETFVVKDPTKFEKVIIPQFFKHSKFSSFVRQLNFYAFRKIKYADTIRIDPQLEAETANYWRFRHEKFQRGKPEWLADIKRMNGQKQQQQLQQQQNKASLSAQSAVSEKESTALKSEVTSLKQRIEDMTKNIDQLTSMVQKVTLAHQEHILPQPTSSTDVREEVGNKRKKIESGQNSDMPLPDEMLSGAQTMDVEDVMPMPPSCPSPMPIAGARETSNTSELSDEGFVDQLFTVFKTEDFDFDGTDESASSETKQNKPRPELMDKLSDALSLLPRDIQEMIVDRLVDAITSPKQIQDSISAAHCLGDVKAGTIGKVLPSAVPPSPVVPEAEVAPRQSTSQQADVGLPLAAATLAALLSQYGQVPKTKQQQQAHKTLPVIPVHA